MKLLNFVIFSLAALSLDLTWAQEDPCPPAQVLSPCTCSPGIGIVCSVIEDEGFNLKEVFDNASRFVGEDVIFKQLIIGYMPHLVEIGDGAVEHLKFEEIAILLNPSLEYISPRAFNATREWTTRLAIFNNNLTQAAPRQRAIFDLANGFKNLRALDLTTNGISSIPDNAFQNLPYLDYIFLSYNPISHIGSRAFAAGGSSSQIFISLEENELPSGGLSEDAFEGAKNEGQTLSFDLACNRMEYLEQKSFQPLLNQTDTHIYIGRGTPCPGAEGLATFACDERVGWICDNEAMYRYKLSGYRCKNETGFGDIWEYCQERNITTATLSYS